MEGTLTVIVGMNTTPTTPATAAWGSPKKYHYYDEIGKALSRAQRGNHLVVEIIPDGMFRILELSQDIDIKEAASDALVYRYQDGVDRILARKYDDYVLKASPLLKSNFASATLDSLEEAFLRYADFVLETKCLILADVWEEGVNGPRLVLVNRPESIMRNSLVQALSLMLRDASVRPEQNTDETKPVDIRIEWFASRASALVEIKWLGRSTAVQRTPKPEPSYTDYGPSRAQEGADQLADYLDRQVRHSEATAPQGYLVVFDAPRKNVQGPADPLCEADAMYFANDVLEFDPNHSNLRSDFAEPTRCFLNPRKSNFLGS